MTGNTLIYWCQRLPLVGKLFKDRLYAEGSLKDGVCAVAFLLKACTQMLYKALYVCLAIWLPAAVVMETLTPQQRVAVWYVAWSIGIFGNLWGLTSLVRVLPVTVWDLLGPRPGGIFGAPAFLPPAYDGPGEYPVVLPGGETAAVELNSGPLLALSLLWAAVAVGLLLWYCHRSFALMCWGRQGSELEEKELVAIHRLAEKSYIGLLDLSTHAEIAVIWNDDDLREYSRKRRGVCDSLQLLKEYVHTPLQKSHIDSLCLLLWNKELLLAKAMHTFNELQGIGDIVQESIPAIVSTARKQAARQKENTVSPGTGERDTPKKKRSIWDIFRRKENKSAYLQQREETERKRQSLSATPPTGTTTRMLRSLNERVALEQAERQARLLAQMDSLYTGSVELNGRMNNMVSEFERENNERFTARYKAFVLERDNSYYMIVGLALSVSLLAIMLYTIIHRDLNRRLRYERELEQSDRRNRELLRSRKELMASVAHDLRAPLAAVKGCAELLPSESDVSRRTGYLDNILHSSDYMLGLVNTLMEYHRMDEGGVRSNDTLFSLKVLFEEIADGHRLAARQKNLMFTVSFSGLDTIVCCDGSHIRQIADNLLSNA